MHEPRYPAPVIWLFGLSCLAAIAGALFAAIGGLLGNFSVALGSLITLAVGLGGVWLSLVLTD